VKRDDDPARPGATLVVDVRVDRERGGHRLEAALEVPPGVTILFGASGAGKSTLLAAIAGLVRPAAGRVALGSDTWLDVAQGVDVPVHLRRVAFVFQSLALFPHMTARENVSYGIPRDVSAPARATRALEGLERFRASHLADRRPSTYSGGEAQRVALARAFAMQPRLVLLDEPFSAMDGTLRRELGQLVPMIAEDLGVPVLHVTHDPREARAIGERAVRIADGKVAGTGSVEEIVSAEDDGRA
jgi:molybdate transport system ATP-binding protein